MRKNIRFDNKRKRIILFRNEIFYLSKYKEYKNYLNQGYTTVDFFENTQISLEVRVEVI